MFAIDGVKLPSNAAKSRSGTRTDFERQAAKLEAAAKTILQRHREEDAKPVEPDLAAKEAKRIERLKRDAAQIRGWLADHPEERRGVKGSIRKSNRTDNESAKMATGKGVIQGYTGVAAVDGHSQIIVCAQAHGTGSEQELLVPVVVAMKDVLADNSVITADAGYHSEENLKQLAAMKVEALIADNGMRGRDERFATASASQRWSRSSATSDTTRGSIASRSEDKRRSMRNGSSSVWSTTSKSSLITGMRSSQAK